MTVEQSEINTLRYIHGFGGGVKKSSVIYEVGTISGYHLSAEFSNVPESGSGTNSPVAPPRDEKGKQSV